MTDNKNTIKPFYIKYVSSMTDEIVQEVFDKAVAAGAISHENVSGTNPSSWDYFGVDAEYKTYCLDNSDSYSEDSCGNRIKEAIEITLGEVDSWLGNTPPEGSENTPKSSCDKTSPSINTIASDEGIVVPQELTGTLKPLTTYSLEELISLTKTHPLISFTFINGRCELEHNETIYSVTTNEDVAILVAAIATLDKYKSEEN